MSDLILLPDVEQLLVDFFNDQDELLELDTDHDDGLLICTVLPTTKQWPALRVTRFGGTPALSRPLYLDRPTVQVDAFGGPKKLAWRIAETARAVMAARLPGSHELGQVTDVTFGALADVPDVTFDRPVERCLFTATITTHPLPAAGS